MAVTTVLGPVPAAELGRTLMHEHLLADRFRVSGKDDYVLLDRQLAAVELAAYAGAGGRTLVDLTVPDFGRDPEALAHLSQVTGVQIVMGAGWYHEKYYPPEIDRSSVDALARSLVAEFEHGVGDTGIRPGIIGELGAGETGGWMTAQEERVFRAAGRAQRAIGCPVTTHAFRTRVGMDQVAVLKEEGADPRSIIVGHCDSIEDPGFHEALAATGAWVQFDLLRATAEEDIRKKVEVVVEFWRRGHADAMLLSQDVCMKSHLRAYGGMGYTGLFDCYEPRLLEAGLPAEVFHQVVEVNPARVFGS